MQENISPDKIHGHERSDSGKKKHISPQEPKDLLTCSSFIARELVPLNLMLGVLNKRDAVAQYISSGVIEFGRRGKPYKESGETIARALGIPSKAFRDTVSDLKKAGVIGRTGKNGDRLRFRRWFVPALEPFIKLDKTAGGTDGDRGREGRAPVGVNGGGTVGVRGGLLRESGSERIMDEVNKEEEDPKTPPPVVSQDSFKNLTAEDAVEYLEPYNLLEAKGLSQGYYDAIAKVSGCYRKTMDDLDVTSATKCLEDLSPDYRRPEILAGWIWWRACRLPRKWNKDTHFFTRFEDTWPEYLPTATETLERLREAERAQGAKEASKRMAERQRQWEQEDAERKLRHKAFVSQLPTIETICIAIKAVPAPETFDYNDVVTWMNRLADALGLGLVMEPSPYEYNYFKCAYKSVGYDPESIILESKRFFARIAKEMLEQLWDDENQNELKPMKITRGLYCGHFGLQEGTARFGACDIPEGVLEYRKSRDGDQEAEADA